MDLFSFYFFPVVGWVGGRSGQTLGALCSGAVGVESVPEGVLCLVRLMRM